MLHKTENPVELAQPYAHVALLEAGFNHSQEYKDTLAELVAMAGVANFFTRWRFEASLGFVIPQTSEHEEKVVYTRFDNGLFCEGSFYSYSALSIGRLIGTNSVRSLCLTFDSGFFATPDFIALDEGDMLHIPVDSVVDIEQA